MVEWVEAVQYITGTSRVLSIEGRTANALGSLQYPDVGRYVKQ